MSYLREVVFAALVCGILVRLAPGDKTGSGKYVKYAASLAFLCILVSPAIKALGEAPDIIGSIADSAETDDEESSEESKDEGRFSGSLDMVASEICKAAAQAVAEHFSVPAEDFKIKIIIDISDSGEYSIREASVYPSGSAADVEKRVLEAYFHKILGCPAEVITDE